MIDFKNDEELKKWLKNNFSLDKMTEEEIDQEIINSFGQETLDELNAAVKLDSLNWRLCDLLDIEPVSVIFEEMEEDARYYFDGNYIAISTKFIYDEQEQMKCLIHEVRHLYQRFCITHKDCKLIYANKLLISQWKEDLKRDYHNVPDDEKICMPIEVDAFAFTKFILKEWFNIDYHHYDLAYDTVLSLYIDKYYK